MTKKQMGASIAAKPTLLFFAISCLIQKLSTKMLPNKTYTLHISQKLKNKLFKSLKQAKK